MFFSESQNFLKVFMRWGLMPLPRYKKQLFPPYWQIRKCRIKQLFCSEQKFLKVKYLKKGFRITILLGCFNLEILVYLRQAYYISDTISCCQSN